MSANIAKPPPATASVFKEALQNPQVSQQAKDLAKSIDAYQSKTMKNNWQQLQAAQASGQGLPAAEAALAADIANLHNMQREFYKQTGDQKADEFVNNASLVTIDGSQTDTNNLLNAAGSQRTQDDFVYSGQTSTSGRQGDQMITAQLKPSTANSASAGAGAGFNTNGPQDRGVTTQSSSADGTTNQWSTVNTQQQQDVGAAYPSSQQEAERTAAQVLKNPQGATTTQLAVAYAFVKAQPQPQEALRQLGVSAEQWQAVANKGDQAGVSKNFTSKESFDKIYTKLFNMRNAGAEATVR